MAGGNGGMGLGGNPGGAGGAGFTGNPGNPGSTGILGGGGGGGAGGGVGGSAGASTGGAGGTSGNPNGQDGESFGQDSPGGGEGGGYNGNGVGATAISNASPLTGGDGGNGGDTSIFSATGGGGGGAGGYGAIVTGAVDGSNTSSNTSTITGGTGGAGGHAGGFTGTSGGDGGDGGVGVQFTTTGATFTNSGTVAGGNGGAAGAASGEGIAGTPGAGGVGIVGAGLTIIDSNKISGGLGGDGVTRADAIDFTGGTNTLTLEAGYSIVGNVVAYSTADTLALGGIGTVTFDVSLIGASAQYEGFGVFEKTGTSTWTLTGTTTAATAWTISGGTLDIAALGAAGTGAITFAAGPETLAIENAALSNHNFANSIVNFSAGELIDLSGLTFAQGAAASYNPTTHVLSVTSNGVTDTLTLTTPGAGTFKPISDGHAGTEIELIVPPTITGTQANQQSSLFAQLHPFGNVVIGDTTLGQTETVTITRVENTGNANTTALFYGVLSDPNAAADHSHNVNGVYTVIGSPSAVTSALQGLLFSAGLDDTHYVIHAVDTVGQAARITPPASMAPCSDQPVGRRRSECDDYLAATTTPLVRRPCRALHVALAGQDAGLGRACKHRHHGQSSPLSHGLMSRLVGLAGPSRQDRLSYLH